MERSQIRGRRIFLFNNFSKY
ncbi:hypothetical protein CCACVL1_00012, partial [Corchorus capsularis]